MKCPKCEGRGYKEYEAGLIQIPCKECNATGEVPGWKLDQILECGSKSNDNPTDRGAGPDNKPARGADTSKPKQLKKSRARTKARKKSS